MSNSTIHEFAKLVHDVRHFIQQDMRPVKEKTPPSSAHAPTVQVHTLPKNVPESETPPPDVLPKQIVPAKATTYIPPILKGDWELHAMPPPADSSHLHQKLATYTSAQEPPLSVLLILPEDNNPHRLFLENVSRAVTRTFASASVVLYHDGLLGQMQGKLILAPLSLFQKRFPKAQPHIPQQAEGMTWIPLENLDIYAHDVTAKRALWMSIQRSFQS